MTETQPLESQLLDAALAHVAFDGWSSATLAAAAAETGIEPALARALFPRGGVDLALAYHARGDDAMLAELAAADLSEIRFRDRIAFAVRARLEAIDDKEAVRRATTLFALPQNAAAGTGAIWQTAGKIWTALGDTDTDFNWYSKRATLSGVFSATVLFWLGDDSDGHTATWDFLDRRIDDVMQFEKAKAQIRGNKALAPLLAGPMAILSRIRAPQSRDHMPGHK
nr:COQ9 family protein [Actibacterium mucosum]